MTHSQKVRTVGDYGFVVVANRLPVDMRTDADGKVTWSRSPGGLVTALEPVMRSTTGAWVGWVGTADTEVEAFDSDGVHLVPVTLSADDVEEYYEGFSNDTLWPLYHDVISPPTYHREWWERYRKVNQRFAEAAASVAGEGATVWVHDYQLQLVPRLLRRMRPDLTIGYFHHIPFPPYGIFSQLPWRRQIVDGLLGADVVGFQRAADAANFATGVRRLIGTVARPIPRGVEIEARDSDGSRIVMARAFPVSIDAAAFEQVARSEHTLRRAAEIRAGLGDPKVVILGVDRLDYTKGILHRLKAFKELLADGRLSVEDVTLVQVASPSRERVAAYQQLRDEVELTVGRINGDFATLEHTAVSYFHHSFPYEEMAALYVASDVLLVTALRDGMNLVAKEYVASRFDEDGVLVLSEFAGASDELRRAVLVNPHDIDGLKDAIVDAVRMPRAERRTRMRALRRRVFEYDVAEWSKEFLHSLEVARSRGGRGYARTGSAAGGESGESEVRSVVDVDTPPPYVRIPEPLTGALRELARRRTLLIAVDFDGTLAPEVDDPSMARALPEAREALLRLARMPRTRVALVSGRSLSDLEVVAEVPDDFLLIGSHGVELRLDDDQSPSQRLDTGEIQGLERLGEILEGVAEDHEAIWLERKPVGFALHTRLATEEDSRIARLVAKRAVAEVGGDSPLDPAELLVRDGRTTLEFALRSTTKGEAIEHLRQYVGAEGVFFAGDDVTDEDGFEALGPDDVGVKSGAGTTVANFRVEGPSDVAHVLSRLADFREGDVHEQ